MDSHRRSSRSALAWKKHEALLHALAEAIWQQPDAYLHTARTLLDAASPSVVSSQHLIGSNNAQAGQQPAYALDARGKSDPNRFAGSTPDEHPSPILLEQWQGRTTRCDEMESLHQSDRSAHVRQRLQDPQEQGCVV